ncbi:hypothetical protein OJ997_09955 [Solirubrobacter phytolaccae]|uniref:Uncharacterized protein n=1 Tax=Solirubrobacter phytolaccae TaxID=1404360 RepID=A0A9X3N6Q3_9ACTN|nr:hypothetical protein [Solirubrobacter phytolaccae]MDA0180614.1 hypothetical protein [Solirubrobacter phytolaccae]
MDGPARRALKANARRNAAGGFGRLWRWRSTRAAAWALLDRHVPPGATVAVVGAGNGQDLPLRRLAHRAGRLDLIDLDEHALSRTRRRLRLSGVRANTFTQDVTHGAADAVLRQILSGRPRGATPSGGRVGQPPYDVVIADQFLSQLLYPALSDSDLPTRAVNAALRTYGQSLTNAVVADLAAAAPGGVLILVEDVLGWWDGHPQPFTLDEVLALTDPDEALALVARGRTARGADGRIALTAARAQVVDRAFWRWPFTSGTDYLVCATVARCAL